MALMAILATDSIESERREIASRILPRAVGRSAEVIPATQLANSSTSSAHPRNACASAMRSFARYSLRKFLSAGGNGGRPN